MVLRPRECFLPSEPATIQQPIKFGRDKDRDFELDAESCTLRRSGRVLKLERIPSEILLFLIERRGQLVSREQIVERIWGKSVFLDTDNSINGAIRKIRTLLKDDPEEPRFIQTITGKGYRFIAPVDFPDQTSPQAAPPEPAVPILADPLPEKPPRPKWLLPLASVLALAAALAVAFYIFQERPKLRAHNTTPAGRVMLAVLPFENLTGDANQDYFSDGLTEEMITQLGRTDPAQLGVIARTSVMVYKRNPRPLDEIGRKLGVQYVIEGSVRRDAERVRITAQLIQLKDQTHVWAKEYDRDLTNLLTLQAEIAQEIADETQFALGDQPKANAARRPVSAPTTSYEAYDLYLKGRYFWNKRTPADFKQAAGYFQQAIAKDPNYARAYAGLADTYGLMSTWTLAPQNEFMPKARTAALRALQIDDTLAEAHASLALVAENYDYDWQTAEKEFRRAIQFDPDYATAHEWYAEYLSWQERFDEALAESERAQQLDPLSLIIATDRGTILYYSRQYDRAIAQCRGVLDQDPRFALARVFVFYALIKQEKFPEALHEIENAPTTGSSQNDSAQAWADKAYLYGLWGRTAQAQHALEKFGQLSAQLQDRTQSAIFANLGAGRNDQAIAILQKAYSEHSNIVTSLKVDPRYDPLRTNPKFQQLLRNLWPPIL
jgi:TolB-like protein/DNA-binding winged helix-turn-helix (wHTH) protein/Tfp pilus assembly protein PilF